MGMFLRTCETFTMFRYFLLAALACVAFGSGGWQLIDKKDANALALLESHYWPQSIGRGKLQLMKIQAQVVSGMNYRYYFNVAGINAECIAQIYHQPWTGTVKLITDTCKMYDHQIYPHV